MNEQSLRRRIARRETHRSRSGAAIVLLVVVAIVAAWIGVELVLAAIGVAPLLVSPSGALVAYSSHASWLPVAGGAAVVVGLLLLLVALLPGRRARHSAPNDRMVVVVDDAVIAAAVSRAARRASGVRAGRVHASVTRSRAEVRVTPSSGVPLEASSITAGVDSVIAELSPHPRLRGRAVVTRAGVVGS